MIHYSGEWKNINAKTVRTTYNTSVNPFNTVMTLKYFASDDLENKDEIDMCKDILEEIKNTGE